MFTVCPKCALTLVVTASDLRVAQGYVRCGRCSNVFNAIVGLSEDRSGGSAGQQGNTASTTLMRKAPALEDIPPERFADSIPPVEKFASKPVPEERFTDTVPPERFADTMPPKDPPPSPPKKYSDTSGADDEEEENVYAGPEDAPTQEFTIEVPAPDFGLPPARFVAPPQFAPAPYPPPPKPVEPEEPQDEERFTDSTPDASLEFNPAAADVSKVFVEAPVQRIDLSRITGQFQQIASEPEEEPEPPTPIAAPPPLPPPPPPPPRAAAPVRQAPQTPPPRQKAPEDSALEDELRMLAARLDSTGKQPILRTESPARPAPKKPAPKLDAVKETARGEFAGSPYNSADAPTNVARKVAASASSKRRVVKPPTDDDENVTSVADELTPSSSPLSRKRRMAWIGGAAALSVVLVAQAIHYNRHDLATNPRLNRPLTSFYSAIGVKLVPRWNLASYDVRQLGAFSGGGDNANLTVRASLKNNANQPLPLPLLRITVQDRYGNRIATRDVQPKNYAPGALPADARLGIGQRLDAEITFKDPGRDAVGFEIDACLPTPEGRIACANDASAAASRR